MLDLSYFLQVLTYVWFSLEYDPIYMYIHTHTYDFSIFIEIMIFLLFYGNYILLSGLRLSVANSTLDNLHLVGSEIFDVFLPFQ